MISVAIDLIPGKSIRQEINDSIFKNLPLYNQPEYLDAVSYGNAWFARIQLGETEPVFPNCILANQALP